MKKTFGHFVTAFAILSVSFSACKKDLSTTNEDSSAAMLSASMKNKKIADGIIFYALAGNMLDKYSTTNPENIISSVIISGLQPGEEILGIDFRPANNLLYALGSNSRLYTVNTSTGVATLVAALTMNGSGAAITLEGSSFGFDFNPAADRLRIISNTGQNLRVVPTTGVTFVDGRINPQSALVNSAAYDNNDNDPSTPTKLYALDASSQTLFEVNPPNAGTLTDPLPVQLKTTGDGGFDIAPRNVNVTTDIALALYDVNKKATLFCIDVETGDTRILAKYNKSIMYSALAIGPEVAP